MKQHIGFLTALEMWVAKEYNAKYVARVIADLVEVYTGNKTSTMPVYENYRKAIICFQNRLNKQ